MFSNDVDTLLNLKKIWCIYYEHDDMQAVYWVPKTANWGNSCLGNTQIHVYYILILKSYLIEVSVI